MADDNWPRRPRVPDAFRRAVEPPRAGERASGSDPLAELARLIGKNDPYAEFGLSPSRRDHEQESYPTPAPAYDDQPHGSSHESYEQAYDHADDPRSFERYPEGRDSYAAKQDLPAADDAYADGWQSEQARSFDQLESTEHQSDNARSHAYADEGEHHGHYLDEEEPLDGYTEQIYDDAPRAARRGGLTTALALIGCAMLGTAGAYAYRSYSALSAAAVPPPVITADNTTPTKIIPAPSNDSQSGKIVQDRIADAGREQVVSNQEEPVPTREIGTQAAPRVVLPSPVTPLASAPAPQQGSISSGPSSAESKKVRTVTIRPDGTEIRPAGPRASVQDAVTPSAGAAPPRGLAPLSLDPQGGEQARVPAAKTRVATAPPPARSESTANSSGKFLVQLSSQRTEAEATASFRSLQAKFPNELSGRTPIVRRADLGSKGVFYRTMVGPFASAQEAHQFCATFKAAGGHCVVPNE
jgi:hypothetical protein